MVRNEARGKPVPDAAVLGRAGKLELPTRAEGFDELFFVRLSASGGFDLLFERGINFNDLPAWQRRGVGVRWTSERRVGVDKRTNTPVEATRRALLTEFELPMKAAAISYLEDRVREAS